MLDPHASRRVQLAWCGLGALLGMLLAAVLVGLMLASEPEPARWPEKSAAVDAVPAGSPARSDLGEGRDSFPYSVGAPQHGTPTGSDGGDNLLAERPEGTADRADVSTGTPAAEPPAAPDAASGTVETPVGAGAEDGAAGGDPGARAEEHEPDWRLKRDPVAIRSEFVAKYADQLDLSLEQRRIFEHIVAEHQSHPEHPGEIWGYFDVYRKFRVYLTAEQARRFDEITPTAR